MDYRSLITIEPGKLGGKPCIRGLRITVYDVLNYVALRPICYELRVGLQGVNYRMLYFFHGKRAVVLSHGLVKERAVSPADVDKAIERKMKFTANPTRHTHKEV